MSARSLAVLAVLAGVAAAIPRPKVDKDAIGTAPLQAPARAGLRHGAYRVPEVEHVHGGASRRPNRSVRATSLRTTSRSAEYIQDAKG